MLAKPVALLQNASIYYTEFRAQDLRELDLLALDLSFYCTCDKEDFLGVIAIIATFGSAFFMLFSQLITQLLIA